ncbi:MAG: segregation/condensation protein A [bacterium]|nr:segregation/condensation protein A [bacterium]
MNTVVGTRENEYKVDLGVFHGPLDLLLYLLKKEEVDIYEIPVAKITQQYLQYLELMTTLNLEIAGEYILMAATLIRVKSRMLLPRDESDPEEVDPREELVMALIEYRKYKEVGEDLRERALEEERNYIPPRPVGQVKGRVDYQPATTLFDLMSAFQEVLKTRKEEVVHEVVWEEISIEDRMKTVLKFMSDKDFATFTDLFADIPRKIIAVVTFIAILELTRARRIAIHQSVPFAELRVYRGEKFHDKVHAIDLVTIDETKEALEAD